MFGGNVFWLSLVICFYRVVLEVVEFDSGFEGEEFGKGKWGILGERNVWVFGVG